MWANSPGRGDEKLIKSRDKFGDYFAPWCVDELDNIVGWTDCKIVVISTWRAYCDVKYLWEYRRLPGKCLGATPVGLDDKGPETVRGLEVEQWCKVNGVPDKFVIIDDINEFQEFGAEHYIQTNSKLGLTRVESEKAINLLLS